MVSPLFTPVMTLPEYLKGDMIAEQAKPMVEMFAHSSDIIEVFPIENLSAPVYQGFRQSTLPTLAFRGINEGSTSGAGTLTPFSEATYIIDHDIPIDRAIVDRGGPRRRAIEERNGMSAAGELWVNTFLKGSNSTNPRVFNGLQARSARYGRTIDNSAGTSGGTALSLFMLDQAINNTRNPTHIIAPWLSKPLWIQAARNTQLSGFVMQTWEEVGKPKLSYAGLPFLWGYPKDLHPAILPFSEVAPAGGAAQTSSLYVVSFGEDGLRGIQMKPMEIRDVGLTQDSITYLSHLSWDIGLVDEGLFSFSRLCGWKNVPIVA